jgi:hypothetical protein
VLECGCDEADDSEDDDGDDDGDEDAHNTSPARRGREWAGRLQHDST